MIHIGQEQKFCCMSVCGEMFSWNKKDAEQKVDKKIDWIELQGAYERKIQIKKSIKPLKTHNVTEYEK